MIMSCGSTGDNASKAAERTVRPETSSGSLIPARRVHGPLYRRSCGTIPLGRACFNIVASARGFAFLAGLGVGLQIGASMPGGGLLRFENRLPLLRGDRQALGLVEVAGTKSLSRFVFEHACFGARRRRSYLWIRVLPCLRSVVNRLPVAHFAGTWHVRDSGSTRCGPALVVCLTNGGQWQCSGQNNQGDECLQRAGHGVPFLTVTENWQHTLLQVPGTPLLAVKSPR